MKCVLCDLKASHVVWAIPFCKSHYEDLEVYLRKHPTLSTVKFFVKTNGTMKEEDKFKKFYNMYVEKL